MKAGLLRSKITIQKPGTEIDTNGQPLDTPWTDYATIWAFVRCESGDESVVQQQLTATQTYRINMRYLSGVKAEDQILFGDLVLKINYVNDIDNRHRELDIRASVVAG